MAVDLVQRFCSSFPTLPEALFDLMISAAAEMSGREVRRKEIWIFFLWEALMQRLKTEWKRS
jgi:hypothetical protein